LGVVLTPGTLPQDSAEANLTVPWGLRLPIRQEFDQYANVRPTRILPGIAPPLAGVGPG
jgi:isocitrate/isopropylmalate dehydrogenase